MGLISNTAEIVAHGTNIKYYREKGYYIPTVKHKWGNTVKKGTKIIVNVKDLSPNSTAKVTLECDFCKKRFEAPYHRYTNYNYNGLCYCNACSKKVFCGGEKNYCWNKNKTDEEREILRNYREYTDFIKKVLNRDKFTCLCCGKTHENLEVHHLNGYNWYKKGRTDETNAVTLCHNCHYNFHSIYGRGNNTKEEFEKWLGLSVKHLEKYHGDLPTTRLVYCIENKQIYNSSYDAALQHNVSQSSIYNICSQLEYTAKNGKSEFLLKSVKGKHFLWYDDYIKMSSEDVEAYLYKCENSHKRKIICLTTNKIFDSLKKAANFYNISSSSDILYCCKGKTKSSGKLKDGTKLKWMFYEDYETILRDNKLENGEVEISMELINESYKEKLKNGF